jgi:hypothetical protein
MIVVPEDEREGILAMTRGSWSFVRVLLVPPENVIGPNGNCKPSYC